MSIAFCFLPSMNLSFADRTSLTKTDFNWSPIKVKIVPKNGICCKAPPIGPKNVSNLSKSLDKLSPKVDTIPC